MSAPWTAKDRERKKRVIQNVLLSFLAMVRANHPQTNRPCTKAEALEVLRAMQEHAIAKLAKKDGFAVAGQYRELIQEVLAELAAQVED